jgi:hypothetical protein
MKRSTFLFVFGALFMSASLASAQAPAPPPLTNLQFFPKDITRPQLIANMQAFAQALGVGCDYCHVFVAGGQNNDLAADTKPTKKTARVMLALVRDLNAKLPGDVSAANGKAVADVTRVGCATCHRGVPIPKQLVDIVLETGNTKGVPAAVAQYRDLRKQFYGNQSYDFTDLSLFLAAQRSTAAMKPDDAIAYANLNLEFNPNSGRSYQAISQAYTAKMDGAMAIASMEKAVAVEPMNQAFANALNNLKNPGRGRGGAGGGAPAPPARGN